MRHQVAAVFRARGGQRRPLNDHLRALLAEAVFAVEDNLEHRQPTHPQVPLLRATRNRLYVDLGWSETRHHQSQES